MLKQAIDRNDDSDAVRQALYDWLSYKGVKASAVDALFQLEPGVALGELVRMIGGGMKAEKLPPTALATLRRALNKIAQDYTGREERAIADKQQRLDKIKAAFVEGRTPVQVVSGMLQ